MARYKNFKLEIAMANEGMQNLYNISDALLKVSRRLRDESDTSGNIVDHNGNYVGYFEVQEAWDDES